MPLLRHFFIMMVCVTLSQPTLAQDLTIDNQVDSHTYYGYQLFRKWCARCHGTFGQGLAGTNLTESLKTLTYSDFMIIVAQGRNSQTGVMPGWQKNPKVMAGRDAIYSYLKARADGKIGEVVPQKK
jgi:mono/diheme cytochrome c family protein